MAITTENSTQYGNFVADQPKKNKIADWGGRLRWLRFDHTQAAQGDAGSLVRLIRLPPGQVRLILPQSRINHSAMGASRTMDLGWEAYTSRLGVAVAADPNGLDDGVDVSSAGSFVPAGTIGNDEVKEFDSREGVVITAQVNDGTLDAAETIGGYFVYAHD